MKIKTNQHVYNQIRRFSTNGVLRCISGELPIGKTEKDIQDTADILSTIQTAFNYSPQDIAKFVDKKDFLGAYLLPLGVGKYLEEGNPLLKSIKTRLLNAKHPNKINSEIENIIKEVGEHIDLKI